MKVLCDLKLLLEIRFNMPKTLLLLRVIGPLAENANLPPNPFWQDPQKLSSPFSINPTILLDSGNTDLLIVHNFLLGSQFQYLKAVIH